MQRYSHDNIIKNKILANELEIDVNKGIIYSNRINYLKEKTPRGFKDKDGNLLFTFLHNNRSFDYFICRAIWIAKNNFIPKNMMVKHIDGNKENNSICNLELVEIKQRKIPLAWSKEELQFLLENYKDMSYNQLSEVLRRSVKAVRQKIAQQNLPTKKLSVPRWTQEDDNSLKELYEKFNLSVKEIAKKLGRSESSVRLRANRTLGVFRSDAHLRPYFNSENFYSALKFAIRRRYAKAQCCLCDYSKYVQLHHIDNNRKNNKLTNISSLCPTHHVEVTHGEHSDVILFCLWWRVYKDGSCSEIFTNKGEITSKI